MPALRNKRDSSIAEKEVAHKKSARRQSQMTARSRFLVVRPCRTMGGLPRNNIVWSEPEAARWGKTRGLVSAIGARFELLRQLRRKKSRFRHSFLDKVCECIY